MLTYGQVKFLVSRDGIVWTFHSQIVFDVNMPILQVVQGKPGIQVMLWEEFGGR